MHIICKQETLHSKGLLFFWGTKHGLQFCFTDILLTLIICAATEWNLNMELFIKNILKGSIISIIVKCFDWILWLGNFLFEENVIQIMVL